MLFPAGREIRKLPLSQISRSMTGNLLIAVVAGPDPQRPLLPSSVNWLFGSLRSTAVVRMAAAKGLKRQTPQAGMGADEKQ